MLIKLKEPPRIDIPTQRNPISSGLLGKKPIRILPKNATTIPENITAEWLRQRRRRNIPGVAHTTPATASARVKLPRSD